VRKPSQRWRRPQLRDLLLGDGLRRWRLGGRRDLGRFEAQLRQDAGARDARPDERHGVDDALRTHGVVAREHER
jgi:hypothetical protein